MSNICVISTKMGRLTNKYKQYHCISINREGKSVVLNYCLFAPKKIVECTTNIFFIEALVKMKGKKVRFDKSRAFPFFELYALITASCLSPLYKLAHKLAKVYISIHISIVYASIQVWTIFHLLHFNILLAKKIKSPV